MFGSMSFSAPPTLPGEPIRDGSGNVIGYGPAVPCHELLTEAEAVRFLRLDTMGSDAHKTIERYRSAGTLLATRVGKRFFYHVASLRQFLARQTEGAKLWSGA